MTLMATLKMLTDMEMIFINFFFISYNIYGSYLMDRFDFSKDEPEFKPELVTKLDE
jgi:hypothetical protein